MKRFSAKEQLKHVPTNDIVPESYTLLDSVKVIKETTLATCITFTYAGKVHHEMWFPKSQTFQSNGKFYASKWIIEKSIS